MIHIMKKLTIALIVVLSLQITAQNKLLQSGPMVGYSEMREVLLWAQTTAPANVAFRYWAKGQPKQAKLSETVKTSAAKAYTAKIAIGLLEPGVVYEYDLLINNKKVNLSYDLEFQTQKLWQFREDPPAFKFVIGSCLYINDTQYDRPGRPYGSNYKILDAIHKQDPDFMIWMGDNTYLREVDWYSKSGIFYRYTHTRSVAEMQKLLGSVHHYATWDDHDYGPNNSDRSFREKETALEAFKLFWGNPSFGFSDMPGVTTMFQWADVEFFLLDNRYHRSPNFRTTGERTVLGEQQIEWLLDALKSSSAPFKFVVMGGQFLNSTPRFENYNSLPGEREKIINAITHEKIGGVIFLDGDRHHTELSKYNRYRDYTLYDLTVSPLTAGANPRAENEPNEYRVDSTFVGEHNFATLEISGERRDRVLKITVLDKDGNEKWSREIKASDLR